MATFVETDVRVSLEVRSIGGSTRIFAEGQSLTASGQVVRRATMDITDDLSQARRDGMTALLADVVARLKTVWDIP